VAGRREEKKSLTRQRLVDAATKVFAEQGFSAATLDDIAEAAGLTKGAIYSNFASKADLALAVLDRRIDRPIAIFTDVDPSLSREQQFEEGGRLLAEELDDAAMWFRLELECTAATVRNPELLAKLRARDDRMRAALVAALDEHFSALGVASVSTATMADALVAVVNGMALERMKDSAKMPVELITRLVAAVQTTYLPELP
jgi:AcrR family transcriptional regulator